MSPHLIGLVIFLTVVAVFIYVWESRNFITAVVISSLITTFGVLIMPSFILTSLYIRAGGEIYHFNLTLNHVKLILILILLINMAIYKITGSGLIGLKKGAEL